MAEKINTINVPQAPKAVEDYTMPAPVVTNPNKLTLKEQQQRDRKPVKGIFKFHEVPGGVLKFNYHAYAEDPVESFTLHDGRIYTIPYGVAKHLNKNGFYPHYQYQFDKYGLPVERIEKKIRRFNFNSLEFMPEDEETTPELYTVREIQAMAM